MCVPSFFNYFDVAKNHWICTHTHTYIQEELDAQLVTHAWNEFQGSAKVAHSVDFHPEEIVPVPLFRDVCKHRRDLKTLVSIPCWSCLSHYKSRPSEFSSPRSMRDDWTTGSVGCMMHQSSCNVFSGCIDVPMLLPRHELVNGSDQDATDDDTLSNTPTNISSGCTRAQRISASCRLMASLRSVPIMPEGWYRNNLIGARYPVMRNVFFPGQRHIQKHTHTHTYTHTYIHAGCIPSKFSGISLPLCARHWIKGFFDSWSTFQMFPSPRWNAKEVVCLGMDKRIAYTTMLRPLLL